MVRLDGSGKFDDREKAATATEKRTAALTPIAANRDSC